MDNKPTAVSTRRQCYQLARNNNDQHDVFLDKAGENVDNETTWRKVGETVRERVSRISGSPSPRWFHPVLFRVSWFRFPRFPFRLSFKLILLNEMFETTDINSSRGSNEVEKSKTNEARAFALLSFYRRQFLHNGMPQGSAIGPILSTIINTKNTITTLSKSILN